MDVLPKELADRNPVGKARKEPNHSPFLPRPEGRFQLTLNPLKLYSQMLGPAVRRRIQLLLCCTIFCILLLSVAPNFVGSWLAQLHFSNHYQ